MAEDGKDEDATGGAGITHNTPSSATTGELDLTVKTDITGGAKIFNFGALPGVPEDPLKSGISFDAGIIPAAVIGIALLFVLWLFARSN